MTWRYAVKKFDASRKISPADWSTLEQSLVLTPSSFGLQPWKFVVVTDPAVRAQLHPASWNQSQILDASQIVVFASKIKCDTAFVDRYLARFAEVRGQSVAALAPLRGMILGFLQSPEVDANEWATRQVYLALGQFLTVAAVLGIDACPMEGINPAQYDDILGLPASGYRTTVVATAGYRAADDKYATLPKVRFQAGDVIQHV